MSDLNYKIFDLDSINKNNLVKYNCNILKKNLARHFKTMKKIYKSDCQKNNKSPHQEWFTDNFYILEKEIKSILSFLKNNKIYLSALKNSKLPIIYQIIYNFFISSGFKEVSEENIIKILTESYQKIYLSIEELSFLSTAIKIALINNIYFSIIINTNQEPENITKAIAFSIKNLKNLESIDFNKIIEKVSPVEKILAKDPENIYTKMDDESKSYYRYLLGLISKIKNINEEKLANLLLEKSKKQNKHIGFYLKNDEDLISRQKKISEIFININIFVPALFSIIIFLLTSNIFLALVCYLPLWEVIRPLNEYFCLKNSKTDFLPRLDIKNCVPPEGRTLVVVSTILPKADQAKNLKTRLENLYFSNGSGDVNFCILADFTQNKYPQDANDKSQIDASKRIINFLNNKYGDRFFLIVRKRSYSKTQNSYIGWERKRGAITELIRFIKNKSDYNSIFVFEGSEKKIKNTKYIIALDSDTELLIDSTQKLVATALHPLNKPIIDKNLKAVSSGYAILTPKIGIDLDSAKNTLFSRVMAGCGGTTMYDVSSKDLYQNLFSESIFAGKGLIDIDAFYEILDNKFPEDNILSHDILEGIFLRAGFVSDVEVTDGYPSNINSWLSRLHRWIRGDWQNINYIFNKNLSWINKYKLFDNLRRSITPLFSLVLILTGIYFKINNIAFGSLISLIGVASITFSSLLSAFMSILFSGWFTLSRKFYTQVIPQTFEYLFQAIFLTVMLIAQVFISVDAIFKALYRKYISKKNLLQWVTAAQAESQNSKSLALIKKLFWPELIGILILINSPSGELKLLGLLFSSIIPLALIINTKKFNKSSKFPDEYKETLIGYAANMWKFYEDHFNLSCNYLPPDNIQLSPIRAIAYRTSPTNIGFLLISTLAARDFDFIDTETLYNNINHTLTTIENLEKWHGNLYNWYDIKTLKTIDTFISAVDSGNFVSCLIALKEGLKDYYFEKKERSDLVNRLQKIIAQTDLSKFYSKKRNLFSIGYNIKTEKLVDSYYDFLMSEARLTSYFAIAKRMAPKKHWGELNRTLSRNGFYAGPVSWTGTMFEFFMPHLFLPSFSGSLLDEALRYCVYCQQKRTSDINIPWGISESAFFAFDNNLYYQYKAHGVQKLGVKQNLDKDLVISPYSTFLALSFAPKMAMKNLFDLEKLGAKGIYGFFEAIDFTKTRVEDFEIIKSYMAHHIGMSLIATNNAIFENRMQKRFMRDKNMKATKELLEEKIARDAVVFDNVIKPVPEKNIKISKSIQEYNNISPASPNITIFKNSDITNILTDNGSSFLLSNNKCLTRQPIDLIRKPHDIFLFINSEDLYFSATPAPYYNYNNITYQTKFYSHSVSYLSKMSFLQTTMISYLDKTLACEQRQIIIKNNSNSKKSINALITLEPILTNFNDYIAHPAFNKLFITSSYDKDSNILIFSKREREQDNQNQIYLGIGFLENFSFNYLTQKEILNSSNNINSIFENLKNLDDLNNKSNGLPDAIAGIKLNFDINASAQKDFTLIISTSDSVSGVIDNIIKSRNKSHLNIKTSAKSKIFGDTIEDKIAFKLLPILLYNKQNSKEISQNKQDIGALWSLSISGDVPIVLLQVSGLGDSSRIEIYIKTLKKLRLCGILFDLVLTYRELQGEIILKNFIESIIKKLDASLLLKIKGGIFLINLTEIEPEKLIILKALSHYIVPENLLISESNPNKYLPIKIQKALPAKIDLSNGFKINGGTFLDNKFYVNKTSSLPYCHILSNQTFGTLVSDNNLGFSWAMNSRENKLTPWFNDIFTDNDGELLILKYKQKYYNILSGSQAIFSPTKAKYTGIIEDLEYIITIWVPEKGNSKYCNIKFINKSTENINIKLAYYIEPVLGVNYLDSQKVWGKFLDNKILLKHCLNQNMISLSVDLNNNNLNNNLNIKSVNNKSDFFSGNWEDSSNNNFLDCASLISELEINSQDNLNIEYCLAFIKSKKQLENNINLFKNPKINNLNKIQIETPDKALNYMINTWVPHQIICGRIWARTGFYQCGGAFGFRDQLQDSLCYINLNPNITKQQIIRASCAQFQEGDVFHWWHNKLSNNENIKGVRTRYSDDLLWLAYVTSEYINKTGDLNILDIKTYYIDGPTLKDDEHEKYFQATKSNLKESIYQHCLKAIEYSLNKFGSHNLPLIGCGDWSDGYNRVGINKKGESVWLGMFLIIILENFSNICKLKNDNNLSKKYLEISKNLKQNIDKNCWDGSWYLRAFYDDGSKMGSKESDECKIDSLPQSFSVFAKMPDKNKIKTSLESCLKYLVDKDNMLINLFYPAFVHSSQNPGYVKSYPAGIRENGGQYTHAGMWLAMAFIELGEIDTGYNLLQMLCPAFRCQNKKLAQKYKIEPYYISGDIYSNEFAKAHGGWSIYTGAAGWFYKATIETLLGINIKNNFLEINPKIPSCWNGFKASLEINKTKINLLVSKSKDSQKTKLPYLINLDQNQYNINILY
ncbi:MAG: hypothetical protein J6C55_04560 [Oscillospiraceae bacterium]|nr:hypothetical protein [Oscillospiraceae bacterium]